MIAAIAALGAGLLFGLGLTVSQMINPAKVLGFLDVLGDWDPSLVLVMATAIPVAALGYAFGRHRRAPLCGTAFMMPAQTDIDRRLIFGAVLFGVGWGTVGYCPGPAVSALLLGNPGTVLFVAAMLAGMGIHSGFQSVLGRQPRPA
ncbi:MAG TPA: DUF6691 family protein [Stellaceae bacterium]|nr:DUF6691 family protein [Stellaceae bacterium]